MMHRRRRAQVMLGVLIGAWAAGGANAGFAAENSFPVTIRVDASESRGPLRPIWRFFGGDEPNYTYMKDGERLLGQLGELRPGDVYFRTHNLLTSGDGTPALKWGSTNAYSYDADGRPVYDWTITDRIFDALLARGVRPYVQIGFMPQVLSTRPDPYRHEWRPGLPYNRIMTGWRYPPKDYDEWRELVYQWTKHCVERYGADEANRWYWETWNEANSLPDGYWGGTREEFFKLHDYAVDGVRRALPTARVGGPHTAGDGGDFTRAFLEHSLRGKNFATGERGTPLDFVAFHAKGAPTYVDGHVRMGIAAQLATIDRGFGIVASFPGLKETPIVIGESDPEGCAACQGPMFSYRNGTVYSSYTAASFARKHDLADKHGVWFDGAVTWAFEFEDQPYFAGFRQLASNGIPLPVLNVFRMFSRMGSERVAATSSAQAPLEEIVRDGVRREPDVGVLASRDGAKMAVLVWHYHDDDVPGADAEVAIQAAGLPEDWSEAKLSHYRIDERHSNAYAAWRRMGSPIAPDERQYRQLLKAAELAEVEGPARVAVREGVAELGFTLPRQGVSLLVLEPPTSP
jgi:xylan 1,4-beta-xylosidase